MTARFGVEGEIVPLQASDARACVEIVESLPDWFGYPGASDDVAEAARTQEGFLACLDGRALGFITVRPRFTECLEITYLAVRADLRRKGLGRKLLRAVAELCVNREIESMCLLTLGPSAGSAFYQETVEFYQAQGFWRVREVQNVEWGGASSLVMVAPTRRLLV